MCFDLWMRMPLAIAFIDEVDAITGGARFDAQSGVDQEVQHNILLGFWTRWWLSLNYALELSASNAKGLQSCRGEEEWTHLKWFLVDFWEYRALHIPSLYKLKEKKSCIHMWWCTCVALGSLTGTQDTDFLNEIFSRFIVYLSTLTIRRSWWR